MFSLPKYGWSELELQQLPSGCSPWSEKSISLLSEPSFLSDAKLELREDEINAPLSLPAAVTVASPIKERCITITSRKRHRIQTVAPPPSPNDSVVSNFSCRSTTSSSSSSSSSRHASIVRALDMCGGALKRLKTTAVVKNSPTSVVYVFT